jgi:hypothetical protein
VEVGKHEERKGPVCDDAGRVVGVYEADVYLEPPEGWDAGPPAAEGQVRVATKAPSIWVQRKTCPNCRKMLGWTFLGEPARMREADLLALQKVSGRRADQPMRDVATWLRASYLE